MLQRLAELLLLPVEGVALLAWLFLDRLACRAPAMPQSLSIQIDRLLRAATLLRPCLGHPSESIVLLAWSLKNPIVLAIALILRA